MSQLSGANSKFDVITHDPHPNALAGLMLVLDPDPTLLPSPPFNTEGTPVAGPFQPGQVVMMDANGHAVLGVAPLAAVGVPVLPFVTVDGDSDLDGAAMHRLTCIQGGLEIITPYFEVAAPALTPGTPLTFGITTPGNFEERAGGAATGQIYGFVGPQGQFQIDGIDVLDVIIPQNTGLF
jgi:hypothetical protein